MSLTPIHPGEHLAEELMALKMSAAALARKLDVPTNRVTQILNGTRAITGDTALRLAHFFGTSAEFWLNCASPRRRRESLSRHCRGWTGVIRFEPEQILPQARTRHVHDQSGTAKSVRSAPKSLA